MMHITHIMHSISLSVEALDGVPLDKDGRYLLSTLAAGPSPQPPRARVTATAKYFQREGLNFRFRFAGSSHFS